MQEQAQEETYTQTSIHVKGFVTLLKKFFELCKQYKDDNRVPVNPNRDGFYTKYNKDVTLYVKEASLFYNGLHSICSVNYKNTKHEELLLGYKTRIILSFSKDEGLTFLLRCKEIPLKQSSVLSYIIKQGYSVSKGETVNYLGRIKLYLNF